MQHRLDQISAPFQLPSKKKDKKDRKKKVKNSRPDAMPESHSEPNRTQNHPDSKQQGWQSGVHYPNPPDPESATTWRSGVKYPNPPDPVNPDRLTLQDQWLFATRNYSRWYARAWGAAILAGGALYFVGRMLKGSDPVHSHPTHKQENPDDDMHGVTSDK